jgi:hypothetical protein
VQEGESSGERKPAFEFWVQRETLKDSNKLQQQLILRTTAALHKAKET